MLKGYLASFGISFGFSDSRHRKSSVNIYKFRILGVYQLSSVRTIIGIRIIGHTYTKDNMFLILTRIQIAVNCIEVCDLGYGNNVFSGYQRFRGINIHSQIPDLLNIKQKNRITLIHKATRPSKFRSVAFRLPIARDLALSFGCDV